MPVWLIWLIIAGVLAGGETLSGTFVLLMMSGGALAAAIAAGAGAVLGVQVAAFVVVTVLLLWLVRPFAVRVMLKHPITVTNSDRLVGHEAVVLRTVTRDEGGLVRLNGAEWSARTPPDGQPLAAGMRVRVVAIQGATAIVLYDPSIKTF
jgi:membrane protein implicated in regulation of membrane protease activity